MKQILIPFLLSTFCFSLIGCVSVSPNNYGDQIVLIPGVYQEGQNTTEPKPSNSEYFKTTFGGFKVFGNSAGFVLDAELLKKPAAKLYTKCVIENPEDPSNPIIYTHYIDSSNHETHIEHGPVSGLQVYKDYTVELIVYDDATRKHEIDRLTQKIRSYIDTTGPTLLMKNGMVKNNF